MKFNTAAAIIVAANVASANQPTETSAPQQITTTVTAVTTYCPSATAIAFNGQTYTANGPTVLTISCPTEGCTVIMPVTTATSVSCASGVPGCGAFTNSTSTVPAPGINSATATPAASLPNTVANSPVGTDSPAQPPAPSAVSSLIAPPAPHASTPAAGTRVNGTTGQFVNGTAGHLTTAGAGTLRGDIFASVAIAGVLAAVVAVL